MPDTKRNCQGLSLEQRLVAYSAMAGAAVGLADPAFAQSCSGGVQTGPICFTDINPDANLDVIIENIDIDFDGDGDPEVRVELRTGSIAVGVYQFVQNPGDAQTGWIRAGGQPAALSSGATISAGAIDGAGNQVLERAGGLGNFGGQGDRYIGYRFDLTPEGTTHFGWVLVNVASDGSQAFVRSYAYNTTPMGSLTAGQTTPVELLDFSVK